VSIFVLISRSCALATLLLSLAAAPAFAADASDDEKHENHYKQVEPIENEQFRVDIADAHSQAVFCQFKAKIANKSEDYVIVSKSDVVFDMPGGKFQPNDGQDKKPLIVEPRGKGGRTFKVKGDGGFHVDGLSVEFNGFSTVDSDGKTVEAADFQLPASRNDFKAGAFKCKLDSVKQETKQTVAKFTCQYDGTGVGFISPNVLGIRIQSGQEFANVDRKAEKKLLLPGDSASFQGIFEITAKIVDMQFATMHVVWRETFTESKREPVEMPTLTFELDPVLTAEKNGEGEDDKKKK
jgi:hypothetical protein